jgi:hypothetical protein
MKNWTQTEMPDFMSVAFSSERSLQDELERESEAEIVTVVISYAVMFAYIAVALGQFRSFRTLLVSNPGQSVGPHYISSLLQFKCLYVTVCVMWIRDFFILSSTGG